MCNIAICDNDVNEIIKLKKTIESIIQELEFKFNIYTFSSGKNLLESTINYDIILLNITVENQNAMHLGMEIKKRNFVTLIIYISNVTNYIFPAFNIIHAFAYLLKPIDKEILKQQLKDATKKIKYINEKLITLSFLTIDYGILSINIHDIFYFRYNNRKIEIITKYKNRIYIKEKIYNLATRMEVYGFAMPHQSYVVQLIYVDSILGNEICMRNGDKLPLSQKRASLFRKKLINISINF